MIWAKPPPRWRNNLPRQDYAPVGSGAILLLSHFAYLSEKLVRWLYWPKSDTMQELALLPVSSAEANAAEQPPPTAPISQ